MRNDPKDRPDADPLQELRRAIQSGVSFDEALAARMGLNLTDLRCSSLVDQEGPLTAGRLASLMGLTTGAITGVLDRLEKAGFVSRSRDPADRRQVIVETVPEKGRAFDDVLARFFEEMGAFTSRFQPEELEAIVRYLQGASAILQDQGAQLRACTMRPGRDEGDEVSAPLDGATKGRLEIVSGASNLDIRGQAGMSALYLARLGGRPPKLEASAGVVRMEYTRFTLFDLRKLSSRLTLNAAIPWSFLLRGGISKCDADLRDLVVESIEVRGGVSHAVFTLGRPSGTVPIRLTGGSHHLSIRRPADVPVCVRVSGGANRLALDSMYFGAIGGHSRVESPDYARAVDRYEVEVTGGASGLAVEAY
ncbi:MAG TPA: MarR family transcriptional regulator [Vulgatibacter sp.]